MNITRMNNEIEFLKKQILDLKEMNKALGQVLLFHSVHEGVAGRLEWENCPKEFALWPELVQGKYTGEDPLQKMAWAVEGCVIATGS